MGIFLPPHVWRQRIARAVAPPPRRRWSRAFWPWTAATGQPRSGPRPAR